MLIIAQVLKEKKKINISRKRKKENTSVKIIVNKLR